MKTTNVTSLRKELFGVIEKAVRAVPTRIRSRKGDAVILSYTQYEALTGKKKHPKKYSKKGLQPLVTGKILKPLNENAEDEVVSYLGL